MYSYNGLKVLFFLLFGLKEIVPTPGIYLENDITKLLDYWFDEIFVIDAEEPAELFDTINEYELNEKYQQHKLYLQGDPWSNLIFQNISFRVNPESQSEEWEDPILFWKFAQNQLQVFYKKIRIRVWGTICKNDGEIIADFNTFLGIENSTLNAKINDSSEHKKKLKIACNISGSRFWHSLTDEVDIIYTNEDLTDDEKKRLGEIISPALPELLHTNINNNPKFIESLEQIFQSYIHPRLELISTHPDILSNPHQYHYLIPKFPFFCFELKRIVIAGLSNMDSFKVHKTSPFFTHTLLIKNIRGSMTLDYRSINETSLDLYFEINSLFVMKKSEISCIKVKAKYYSISRISSSLKSLSIRQQEVLMNVLESAIASSIMPFTKVARICDLDTPLEEIRISNKSDWKSIKAAYRGWIPFKDD